MGRKKGFKHSKATKEKIRLKAEGKKLGYKRKSYIPNKNQLKSLEEGRKIAHKNAKNRKPFLGRKHTEETKKKIREKKKGIRVSPKTEFKRGIKNIWRGIGKHRNSFYKRARRIMEENLGRKLNQEEIVHHISGDWKDNNINNLQVMTRSEHARLHKLK